MNSEELRTAATETMIAYNPDLRERVFRNSSLKPIYDLFNKPDGWLPEIIQAAPANKAEAIKWHYDGFIRETLATARLWAGLLLDGGILPPENVKEIYDPHNADHGAQHDFRTLNDFEVCLILAPETRDLNREDKNDIAVSGAAAIVGHDMLQVLTTNPDNQKRIGHDEIGARFLIPGLMKLGNILGLTDYSDRQMALAVIMGFNHESEHDYVGINIPPAGELIADYEAIFGREISKVYPVLGWLRQTLWEKTRGQLDLFTFEFDFKVIDPKLALKARQMITAADWRDQFAPPWMGAKRALGADRGRPMAFMNQELIDERQTGIDRYPQHKAYIDYLRTHPGYNPYSSTSREKHPDAPQLRNDDLSRAVFEVCRSAPIELPSITLAWAAGAQLRRGDYQVLLAMDMVLLRYGGNPAILNGKYLELAQEVEAEIFLEGGYVCQELSDRLLDLQAALASGNKAGIDIINFADAKLEAVGRYILTEYMASIVLLRQKYANSLREGDFDEGEFLRLNHTVIEYAKAQTALLAMDKGWNGRLLEIEACLPRVAATLLDI